MKPSTEIVLGIRNVGAASEEPILESMTVEDAIKRMIMWTLESRMAQRFQFTIARDTSDARVGLGLSANTAAAKRTEAASRIADMLTGIDMSKYEE